MNATDARIILELLLDGVHPITGEILPDDHVCVHPHVVRALHKAIIALQSEESPNTALKPNVGRPWTADDDAQLRALYAQKRSMEDMCRILKRRPRGVKNRLAYLNLVEPEPGKRNSGKPWTHEDEGWLRQMFSYNMSISEMAAQLKRSKVAITMRLDKLGLINVVSGDERSARPWSPEELNLLQAMVESGIDVALIAERFDCSEKQIRARMFYMGLGGDAPNVMPKRDK